MRVAGDGRHSRDHPRSARIRWAARCRATCSIVPPRSFVGSLSVPMRHGLTPGELALLAKQERGLAHGSSGSCRCRVGVDPEYFDATGLPFYPPSPNLRDLESIINYSGTCLFEGTNLSPGRGSDAAFSQVGAPWLDPAAVLARLGPQPGVALTATTFTPRQPGDGKYADTLLQGIRLRVTDRAAYDAPATALRLLVAIRRSTPPSSPGFRPPFRPSRGPAGAAGGAGSRGAGRLDPGCLAGTAGGLRAPGCRRSGSTRSRPAAHLPLPVPAVILGPVPKVNNDTEIGSLAAGREG